MRKTLFFTFLILFLAGCSPGAPKNDPARAEGAARDFYGHLAAGRYSQAAALYGGDYAELGAVNPEIPLEDGAALWQAACEVNGYQCLPVLEVLDVEVFSLNEFFLTVTFRAPDGSAFVLGPCCGASEEMMPPLSEFQVHVIRQGQAYKVTSAPPYVP